MIETTEQEKKSREKAEGKIMKWLTIVNSDNNIIVTTAYGLEQPNLP
jgi:hypothetical protein